VKQEAERETDGGEGGIRTPDTLASMPDFESENELMAPMCMALQSATDG